jgi:hypothetical protein
MNRAVRAVCFLGIIFLPALASAQDKESDAERLFREGQKLMEERRFGEACPKFEAAYKKDLQLGTLLNLAYCHKEQGATWLSWIEFKEAELKAIELKRTDRRDFARQRLTELEKLLARVVVEPQSKVELTEVLIEDRRVPEAEKNAPFAAEIGQRKFTFRAKGKKQATLLVNVLKGDKAMKVSVPEMEDAPKDAPVETTAPPSNDTSPALPAKDKKGPENQRVLALVAGGVGVIGLGIGTIFGIQTFGNECTKTTKNPPCTEDEESKGNTSGMISNIGFAVGIVGLAAGAYLWFTAPKATTTMGNRLPPQQSARSQLRVVPELGAGWASVRGTF